MKRASHLAALAALCFIAACSRQPELEGTWKNGDGNLLTFAADSSVRLGQEGLSGTDKGRWKWNADTLVVTTDDATDELGRFNNVYTFIPRDEKLYMLAITLYRSGDYHSISAPDLAKRLGKTEEKLAFQRVEGK